MKLSDAIALGRTLMVARPNTFHQQENGVAFGCAIGMARMALGARASILDFTWAEDIDKYETPCDCDSGAMILHAMQPAARRYSAVALIVHLFDNHVFGKRDWTLDQLIDWVRSVEPDETAIPQPTEAKEEPVCV